MKYFENGKETDKEKIILDFLDIIKNSQDFKNGFNDMLTECYGQFDLFTTTYNAGDIAEKINKEDYERAFHEYQHRYVVNIIYFLKIGETYEYNKDFIISVQE